MVRTELLLSVLDQGLSLVTGHLHDLDRKSAERLFQLSGPRLGIPRVRIHLQEDEARGAVHGDQTNPRVKCLVLEDGHVQF